MGRYDPETQEVSDVDPVEVFIDVLGHYEFAHPDPDEDFKYHFYDAGGEGLPYTLQGVLEWYYRHGRAVKITVEDAGEDPSIAIGRDNAERAEQRRQRALVTLEGERRYRQPRIEKYTSR